MTYSPPNAPPPNTITWRIRFHNRNLESGDTNIQSQQSFSQDILENPMYWKRPLDLEWGLTWRPISLKLLNFSWSCSAFIDKMVIIFSISQNYYKYWMRIGEYKPQIIMILCLLFTVYYKILCNVSFTGLSPQYKKKINELIDVRG